MVPQVGWQIRSKVLQLHTPCGKFIWKRSQASVHIDMAQTLRFTSPDELRTHTEEHADMPADSEGDLQVEVALLLPMATASVIPWTEPRAHKEAEYVSLSEVAKAWRTEWAAVIKKYQATLTSIKFDNTLPTHRSEEDGVERKIYWDRGGESPSKGEAHFVASADRYHALVVLLATQARMLKKEKSGLRIVADWEGVDERNDGRWKKLGRRLERLSMLRYVDSQLGMEDQY